jgi:predicted Zn-dependent protease
MALYLRVSGRPDHEVLRVAPGAAADEIEQAYGRVRDELKALGEADAQASAFRQQLDAVSGRARLARDRLLKGARTRRPSGAQDGAERQRHLEAEQAYQQARDALSRDDATAALEAFERAAARHPEAVEYALGSAWLKYSAADKSSAPKLGEQAQRLAARLVSQQPNSALVNLTLGHFLRQERKLDRAQRHLLLALDHEPRWAAIDRELRTLERQRRGQSEAKGRAKP